MKNTFYLKKTNKQAIITIPFDYRNLLNPKLTEIKTIYVFSLFVCLTAIFWLKY